MDGVDLKPLFAGVDDERLLSALYGRIRRPRNEMQATFTLAWAATEMLYGDGFECLLEQDTLLQEYSHAFVLVGMPEVKSILDRVGALIPEELQAPEKLNERLEYIRPMFDELKNLLYEFFDTTKDVTAVLSRYVREHQDDFTEYTDG
jgi:Domain of unknown function (DUF4375)